MNAVSKEFKQTINALSAANTYLDCLVQTKTYLHFLILIIFCIITVYIPFPSFMLNYINECLVQNKSTESSEDFVHR